MRVLNEITFFLGKNIGLLNEPCKNWKLSEKQSENQIIE